MTKIIRITPGFAVAGQLDTDDFASVAALGFRSIVNNRPDDEERGQPTAADGEVAAHDNQLAYAYIPTTKHDIFTDAVVSAMAEVLNAQDGPILAHCKSGQRSAILWAAAAARTRPVAEVLDTLSAAGFDFGFLRDELDRQADYGRWSKEPVAPQPRAADAPRPARRTTAAA